MLKGNNVQGILDTSSLRYMPAGYSLAYGLLKLLRQHIYYNKVKKKDFTYIAKKIIRIINLNLKTNFTLEIFEDLAVTEVLKRILFVVRSILFFKCPYISEDAAFINLQSKLFSLITSKTFLHP